MRTISISIVFLLYLLVGCRDVFMGDEPSAESRVDMFETLWSDFDQHYACFELRGCNWDSLYEVYRPQIDESMSEDELWAVIVEMLNQLDDQHISIQSIQNGYTTRYFVSGMEKVYQNVWFSENYLYQYLEDEVVCEHRDVFHSKIKGKNIGYLYVGAMTGYDIDILHRGLEAVTQYENIILDLRINYGGTYAYVQAIASWLSNSDDVIWGVQVRNGPNYNDFGEKEWVRNKKAKNPYTGKIIVLTNRGTVSAGEWAVESLRISDNVTVIGDTTAGSLSTVSMARFLPNGWQYKYAVQRITRADGTSYEGVGLHPDIIIKNTSNTFANKTDSVMVMAIEYIEHRNYNGNKTTPTVVL